MSVATAPVRPTTWTKPSRHRLAAPLLTIAAIAGVLTWTGADRQPADATQPLVIRGETSPAAHETLRIGTFNIHGGRGPGAAVDLDATADVLRRSDLDLAGLFEVHASLTGDQAVELGERLGVASLFAGTERRWWHDHLGNGLLTRLPLRSVMRFPLPSTQGKGFRNAILTTVEISGRPIRVLATHIDRGADRDRQLAAAIELFRSLEAPAVLIGDLNSTADYPPVAALLAEPGVLDAVAAKLGPGSQAGRIDHVLARGLTVRNAGVVETAASDHPHVWAELGVP